LIVIIAVLWTVLFAAVVPGFLRWELGIAAGLVLLVITAATVPLRPLRPGAEELLEVEHAEPRHRPRLEKVTMPDSRPRVRDPTPYDFEERTLERSEQRRGVGRPRSEESET
jgi:hypothetical protein